MMFKVACIGAGAWGTALSNHLAKKGIEVRLFSRKKELRDSLLNRRHPKFPGLILSEKIKVVDSVEAAICGADLIIESVTTKGVRELFEKLGTLKVPLLLTSKGIESSTGELVPEIAFEIFGKKAPIAYLSGPSLALEVTCNHPTSVVIASFDLLLAKQLTSLFSNSHFHVYPEKDILGVAFGGAMKNIIAIACGIAAGLGFGENTRAALMTFGMQEMRYLAKVKEILPETLLGLSGFGDLCVTCQSIDSRNNLFGRLVGEGYSPEKARKTVGMVVEGETTSKAALELAKKHGIELPITETVCAILEGSQSPQLAFQKLFTERLVDGYTCEPLSFITSS